MARRWNEKGGVAQVSAFFSPNAGVTQDSILEFEHALDKAMVEAAITLESTNPSARLWIDAYSSDGMLTVSSDKNVVMIDAIGIGGDFFQFHPLKLVSGSYFSGSDLMQDYCILDEDTAWQLFGSNDVAGMYVTIGNIPHVVRGVVERPAGRLEEAAGLDGPIVFVAYETLQNYGQDNGINHYEILMPNPVKEFAIQMVKENFSVSEREVEYIENSSRYTLLSNLKKIMEFGTRSMNGKAIIYPFWENIARGIEDICTLITVFVVLFFLYPAVVVIVTFIHWWRHKGWTMKDIWHRIKDRIERHFEKRRKRRLRKKTGKDPDEGEWLEWL